MVKLDKFQGHIVLYCKHHYKSATGRIEDLRKIWAVRCGYDYNPKYKGADVSIANELYEIIMLCEKRNPVFLAELLHKGLRDQQMFGEVREPVEALIWQYCSIISNMQVREQVNGKFKFLMEIPKPMPQVFNRILRGNGRHNDYYKITKQ